jgi:hypothetical protein
MRIFYFYIQLKTIKLIYFMYLTLITSFISIPIVILFNQKVAINQVEFLYLIHQINKIDCL